MMEIMNTQLVSDIEKNIDTPVALGIGDNLIRERVFNRVTRAGFRVFSLDP